MKEQIVLAASARTESGSKAVNRLRRQGQLPGVIYGQDTPKSVRLDASAFSAMQRHHTSENLMMSLEVEGDRAHNVLVREVQHHPLTGAPLHVDFYELNMTKRVTVAIPVELTGEPIGVVRDGGLMEQMLREVEVDCLPDDILEVIEIDVSAIEVGGALSVADIPLDREKYEVLTAPEVAVAIVAAARVDVDAGEGAAGQPEVIGEKKKDAEA